MADKLTFYKPPKSKSTQKAIAMRVDKDQYDRINDICEQTELSLSAVASRLVRYALEHVEILEDVGHGD